MPITDAYVVQYLLQATCDLHNPIVWSNQKSDGFSATLKGVTLAVGNIPTRTGSYLCLTLSDGRDLVSIHEPVRIAVFRARYKTDDDARLASLMRELAQVIGQQNAALEKRRVKIEEVTRQGMFRRLIGTWEPETCVGVSGEPNGAPEGTP